MKRTRIRHDGRQVILEEEDLPSPQAGQVRVKTEWTQVSIGTEVATILARSARGEGTGLGYSHVGIVEELGPEVRDLRVGQRVLALASHASAAIVSAKPSDSVPVPEGLGPDLATLGILGSVAYHIVQRAQPRMSEPTAVLGLGVVGSLILQLLRECGVRPLIAIDTESARLAKALELGASHAVDASSGDAPAKVKELTDGKGVSLCVEAAANCRAYETAIAILRLRGRLVLSSAVYEPVAFRTDEDLVRRELTLIGAHQPQCPREENPYYPHTQARNRLATMEGIRDGRLKVEHLISHRIKPEEAPEVYARLLARDRAYVGVLIDWR